MDQQTHEMTEQTVLGFKCKKVLPTNEKSSPFAKKSGVVQNNNLVPKISCDTPEKINEPLLKISQEGQVKLPENYRVVAESFDHLNCSLKLLGLRKKLPTFENVSTQLEILTKRNFLYSHLAQIKYILPESLQIDKIFIHDKKTLSMKPHMKISLLFDVVNGHSEVSDFVALSQAFSSRLYSFFTTHPEASDVPEAILPEPFNQRCPVIVPDESLEDSLVKSQPNSAETEIFSGIVGLNPHFRRHFSQNAVIDEKEKIGTSDTQDSKNDPLEELGDHFSVSSSVSCQYPKSRFSEDSTGTCSNSVVPISQSLAEYTKLLGSAESPLAKPVSSDDSCAIETPSQVIPKRLVSSCDITHKIMTTHKSTQSCKPAKRFLDFFQSEGDESALDLSGDDLTGDQIGYRDISQIMKGVSEDVHALALPHEIQIRESTSSDISSCLAEKVTLIHSIFNSVNFSAITKEELVHKILVNSLDVVEKSEVDKQLELLERLAPDWIYKKCITSGDIVYNIKDVSDLDSIRMRLTSF